MSDLGTFHSVGPVAMEGVSAVTATPSVQLGTRRIYNGEEYVYFYNNTGSSVTQGAGMVVSGLSGYSLTRSSTAANDLPICFVKHADVAAGSYAWGLVRGLVSAHFASTMTTGVLITIGSDGVVATLAGGSFPTGPCIGKVISAATANGQGLCFVRCFG